LDLEHRDGSSSWAIELEHEAANLPLRCESEPALCRARRRGERQRPQILEPQRLRIELERVPREQAAAEFAGPPPGGKGAPPPALPHGTQVAQIERPATIDAAQVDAPREHGVPEDRWKRHLVPAPVLIDLGHAER